MERNTPASRFAAYNSKGGTRDIRKSEHVNLRLTPDLIDELTAVGNVEGLSMSDTIRMVLWRGIRAGAPQDNDLISRVQALASELHSTLNKETND